MGSLFLFMDLVKNNRAVYRLPDGGTPPSVILVYAVCKLHQQAEQQQPARHNRYRTVHHDCFLSIEILCKRRNQADFLLIFL